MTPIPGNRPQTNDCHANGHGPSNQTPSDLAPGETAANRGDPRDRPRPRDARDQPAGATVVDRPATRPTVPPDRRLAAALVYARRGWRVLPVQGVRSDGRCLCGRPDCASPGKHPLLRDWPRLATVDPKTISEWWRRFPFANVAIATGRASGLVVLDVDPRHGGDESLAQLAAEIGGLPATATVLTGGGGRHLYFAHPGGTVANAAAVGGRAGLDLRGDGGYVVAPPSAHASGKGYAWDPITPKGGVLAKLPDLPPPSPFPAGEGGSERDAAWKRVVLTSLAAGEALDEARRLAPSTPNAANAANEPVPEGRRNQTLTRLAGAMRRQGASREAIAAALLLHNRACRPPLPHREVLAIAQSVARYAAGGQTESVFDEGPLPAGWPEPLDPAAFHGLAGDFVALVEPHTESDPAAILLQLLVYFGNVVGRSAHARVEVSRHFANENVALVGATSKARKGTSEAHVRAIFTAVDPFWARECIQRGLVSGEGFISAVRDPAEVDEPVREKGRVVGYQKVVGDAGAKDKRLLAAEGELARVLEVMAREGNTLSPTLREAWDSGNLNVMSRKDPLRATDAHVSICGHITREELLRVLNVTETANGFANRFLWTAVRRSKCLPEGGDLASVDFGPFLSRLKAAVAFAKSAGEARRDETARAVWAEVYPALSAGAPGLFGAATSRAEAHVLRLSVIYALLDGTVTIGAPHLLAALAVWDYCAASARWVFGERLGDPVAERILAALRAAPEGLRRDSLVELFDRHKAGAVLDRSLALLAANGLVTSYRVDTGGRPAVVWKSTGDSSLSSLSSQPAGFCARAGRFLSELPTTTDSIGSNGESGDGARGDDVVGAATADNATADASVSRDESDESDENSSASPAIKAALALAEGKGWPRLELGRGRAISPGEAAWRKWAQWATEAEAREVETRLGT